MSGTLDWWQVFTMLFCLGAMFVLGYICGERDRQASSSAPAPVLQSPAPASPPKEPQP